MTAHAKQIPTSLSLRQIVGWQIPSLLRPDEPLALLPSLQRGAVWRPNQVEALWDSILRGFPIGAFMLARFSRDRGVRPFPYGTSRNDREPDYHLLDGQQRSNAVTLGFLDPWIDRNLDPPPAAALWLDLEPPEAVDERQFVLRLTTRSHPWGYQRANPASRLDAAKRRDAFQAYSKSRSVLGHTGYARASEIPMREVWPWDAVAPVPFPLFRCAAIAPGKDFGDELLKLLEAHVDFWSAPVDAANLFGKLTENVRAALEKPSRNLFLAIDGVRRLEEEYRLPALLLPDPIAEPLTKGSMEAADRPDPVETWFIRVNSAGTPIRGEELNYSILKSIWPKAQPAIETLSHHLMPPSRLLALVSRVVLARGERRRRGNKPPQPLSVQQFRRLIHGSDAKHGSFRHDLETFFLEHAKPLFDELRTILVLPVGSSSGDHRLPPVVASDLARSAPDIFFLVLYWLDYVRQRRWGFNELPEDVRRHVVGTITAVAWFALKSPDLVNRLWAMLVEARSKDETINLFSRHALRQGLPLSEGGEICMIPLVPPRLLKEALQRLVTNAHGIGKPDAEFWTSWKWDGRLTGNWQALPDSLRKWYSRRLTSWRRGGDPTGSDRAGKILDAWYQFLEKLHSQRGFVLYCQRRFIVESFPNFDPASPQQLEDTDRPWDMDHIHPQKYVYGKHYIPQIIKDWHSSTGNLRAWPLEANRGDGEAAPRQKFEQCTGLEAYGISRAADARAASFVAEGEHYEAWCQSAPDGDQFPDRYLNLTAQYGQCRRPLVTAIVERWLAMYQEWYATLDINSLC